MSLPTAKEQQAPTRIRARWVLAGDRPPIRDGVIESRDGVIVTVGPAPRNCSLECLDAVVVPQFINAHTHLEFSDLAAPLGGPGMPFPDWIRAVLRWRRARDAEPDAESQRQNAILAGLRESEQAGSVCVGEIATSAASREILEQHGSSGVVFWEQIGLAPARIPLILQQTEQQLAVGPATLRRGISPHAPYTVHPTLLAQSVQLAIRHRVPVAMHLAESREELQLLQSGTGPFRELLEELNVWQPDVFREGTSAGDYLRVLSTAPHALVVHGNYLTADEHQILAAHRERMTLVYCPRTHAYFEHDPYPLRVALDAGVRVVLGTDSRATNPDLNLLNELRWATHVHPDVAPAEWLRMVTLDAATALGLDQHFGSLAVGKQAAWQLMPLSADALDDPYSWLRSGPVSAIAAFRSD